MTYMHIPQHSRDAYTNSGWGMMTSSQSVYEVRPRKDHRSAVLISAS